MAQGYSEEQNYKMECDGIKVLNTEMCLSQYSIAFILPHSLSFKFKMFLY